jgi:hypothetical protein
MGIVTARPGGYRNVSTVSLRRSSASATTRAARRIRNPWAKPLAPPRTQARPILT